MSYQSKTTVVEVSIWDWDENSHTTPSARLGAARAIAVQIASLCQMDIMGFDSCVSEKDCLLAVVYVNNGRSLADIRGIMAPVMNNPSQNYWMIQDFEEWEGLLHCIATVRGTNQTWG